MRRRDDRHLAARRSRAALRAIARAATVAALAIASAPQLAHASATPSDDGPLFRVVEDGKWGFIDASGRVVVSPRFDAAGPFSDGFASVRADGRLGYADRSGAVVLVPRYEPVDVLHRPFSGGLAAVKKDGRIGFIDRGGRLAVPAKYLTAEDFSEALALVCSESGCGFVDPAGRYRAAIDMWMGGTSFHGGYASVVLAMGMSVRRTRLVARDGTYVPGEFEGNGRFSEGVVAVRHRGRWGYVDAAGKVAIAPRFGDAGDFSEGLAPVTVWETGRCGYVDHAGVLAIPARFAACAPFSCGRARVDLSEAPEQGERVAFIDRTGAPVIVGAAAIPPFQAAEDFVDGLAAVAVGGTPRDAGDGMTKLGYVDTAGRYVWTPRR